MLTQVQLTRRAEQSLKKVPGQVAANFFIWKREVEEHGLEVVRKVPGYHDEPLQGKLKGRVRSVRMGSGFRTFYRIVGTETKCVLVEEVNKHDYKKVERLFGI